MNKIMKSFRLNNSTTETLERLSKKYGISQSEIIDNAMKFIAIYESTELKEDKKEKTITKMILSK